MLSTADLIYGFEFNSPNVNVSYDLVDSDWDGSFLDNGATAYVFSDSTKAALTNTNELNGELR